MTPSREIDRLLEIMAALRTPNTGCPWDLEQTFETIVPYTIEEAYEVAEAIRRADDEELCDELGDLLLQVVFHARMAQEAEKFAFGDVVHAITKKMIRRHPHVFGDESARTAGMSKAMWESIKAEEKQEKAERKRLNGASDGASYAESLLDDVPHALPALMRAVKLQKRASTVGFDWNNVHSVIDKLHEELREVESELAREPQNKEWLEDEIGDLLFVIANLARHLDIDPESALRGTNDKFCRRFHYIEQALASSDKSCADASLEEMETLWQEAKSK